VSSLARLKGKVVVLDFWATWCGPCIMEIPTLVKMYDDYRSKGLELLGLSVEVNDNRPKEFFDQFISAHKINYPIGLANMDTLKNYGISPIPATFFIDKSGRIALSFVGVRPEGDFIGAVEKLLAE
jgi:thiol-disulfide isomerase/thioredoxin